jgi:hypothetical protein
MPTPPSSSRKGKAVVLLDNDYRLGARRAASSSFREGESYDVVLSLRLLPSEVRINATRERETASLGLCCQVLTTRCEDSWMHAASGARASASRRGTTPTSRTHSAANGRGRLGANAVAVLKLLGCGSGRRRGVQQEPTPR